MVGVRPADRNNAEPPLTARPHFIAHGCRRAGREQPHLESAFAIGLQRPGA
jgi:hypothetical protein